MIGIPDILNKPWAIEPCKFETLLEVYDRHSRGEKFDVAGLRSALADRERAADQGSYTVENGVALLPIEGILAKRANVLTVFSGGTSTEIAKEALAEALADAAVSSVVLVIDSPGGEVDGIEQLADAVAASTKPTWAYLDGMACSGAYWLASQCDRIVAAHNCVVSGSIGVVQTHVDRSKANEQAGKVYTDVTAGKYKRIAGPNAPLSPDGRAVLQEQVDQVYSVFVRSVAKGRGMTVDQVLSDMADGRIFIGQQAIDAGLVDDTATLDQVIAQLSATKRSGTPAQPPAAQSSSPIFSSSAPTTGEKDMAFKTFETEAQYKAEIEAAEDRGVEAMRQRAIDEQQRTLRIAAAIRERVQKMKAAGVPNYGPAQAASDLEQSGDLAKL